MVKILPPRKSVGCAGVACIHFAAVHSRTSAAALLEIRTVAGPSSVVQWMLSGGPYSVWSHVRHVQVVCPPPCPRQAWWPT